MSESMTVNSRDLNAVVLDYLVTEGFTDAARRFEEESGTERGEPFDDGVQGRLAVRECINAGQIEEAVRLINEQSPSLLDRHCHLHLRLLQQHLIELVRHDDIGEALDFAREHLSEKAHQLPHVLTELEQTMSLLAFPTPASSPFAHLLDISHRRRLASEVNAAMLRAVGIPSRSNIETLVKLVKWEEAQLDSHKIPYARITDMSTASVDSTPNKAHKLVSPMPTLR